MNTIFPNLYKRSCFIENIKKISIKNTQVYKNKISILGRLHSIRNFGKAYFADIQDNNSKTQIYLNTNLLKNSFKISKFLSNGTIVWCRGHLFKTKQNNICIKIYFITIIVQPKKKLPLIWKKIKNIYKRHMYRYLDILLNENVKFYLKIRENIILNLKKYLVKYKYKEIETPMLHSISGGADAQPFKTKCKVYKKNLYLRIAPELFLKKFIVAGYERIFELGKSFRNEGISFKHHFEFTLLEIYEAYSDYLDLMNLIEKLINYITKKALKKKKFNYKKNEIIINKKFKKIDYIQSILLYNKELNEKTINNYNYLSNLLKKKNTAQEEIILGKKPHIEDLQNFLFNKTVTQHLIQPTFIVNHPAKFSPLAKRHKNNNEKAERFELYIAGIEIADGFSELNNPTQQKEIFLKQKKNTFKKNNKKEIDYSYLTALEYGLPPTAGVGIGIDRLVMLLSNAPTLNEVMAFPVI